MAKGRNTSISAFGKKTLGKEEVTDAATAVCSLNQLMNQDRNLDTRTKMTLKTGEKHGQECHQVFCRSAGNVSYE